MMSHRLENDLRSSWSDSFNNAASQLPSMYNHFDGHDLSGDEGETSEDGDIPLQSNQHQARSTGQALIEDPDNSEDKSDLDIDSLESPSNDQSPIFSSLRGSFQAHGQASLHPSQLTIPKSRYGGYEPPLDICEEKVAVQELLDALKQQKLAKQSSGPSTRGDDADFEEFELSDFAVYLPPNNKWHPCEMRGLQHLTTKTGHGSFYFDGILSAGSARRYVQGIPFGICSIGNYGAETNEVTDIWIQSDLNTKSKSEIYYRLGAPSSEYERFHEGFVWLANLAKHFVDFCEACLHPVSIRHFRSDFYTWLEDTHQSSSRFRSWYQKYDNEDFSQAIAANINFLLKESIGVDEELRSHPIWSEIMERDSIPHQQIQEKKTVVTPYVYECFKDIRFGHHLLPIEPSSISKMQQSLQGKALDLTANSLPPNKPNKLPASRIAIEIPDGAGQLQTLQKKLKHINVGSVLAVTKDGQGSVWKDEVSRWKAATHNDCWYVYVQGIHESKNGQREFLGIWLYAPADTMCAKMKYPWPNELFFSDNCTCSHSRIKEDEVLDVVNVLWHGNPSEAGRKLFIRQTYLENERFVTLKETHKKCEHLKNPEQTVPPMKPSKYPIGQTVLVAPPQKSRHELEPYEIMNYIIEGSKQFAVLRRLQRRRDIDGTGTPNQLVYTNQTDKVSVSKLQRTCLVRFYSEFDAEKHRIPPPYNRDGTGSAFYITKRWSQEENGISKLIPIEEDLPQTLIQGFDPLSSPPRRILRGMDLYCGGGNFGRGIEEGGAVHNEWAVDINKNAIHTYAANLKDPKGTKLFYGSVDDLLKQALQGNPLKSELVPLPGDVDCLSAGSPCQGFSNLNSARNNETGLKNQSLVASVVAYVDFYRPKYGILENVMAMAQKGRGRDEDVLSQLICAIVGMGYQLQLFVLDAWSCGSPQSRTRLFVVFTAPGLEPLEHPELSHSHPPKVTGRGLGQLANGESFGRRIREKTPFEYVTAGEATKDLPRIGDGCTYQCTKVPAHVPIGMSTELRSQIRAIPTFPRGMNFSKAWNEGRGVMTEEQRDLFPRFTRKGELRENTKTGSRAWGRVNPKGLFPTIVVGLYASDSRVGNQLHWDDHRYLTTMEARRAQSFPDNEVLLGTPAEGWKLMGNSVARSVALSLGLSLREAWLKNGPDHELPHTKARTSLPVLNARKRSGIEVIIPTTTRRNKPESELVVASQLSSSVHNEMASGNLVNPRRRTVAPEKARRSRFELESEKSAGEEICPPIEFMDRPVSFNAARRSRVIPDSAEASADDDSISEETFHRFLGSLAPRTPNSRDGLILSGSGSDRQVKPMSLKRPHGMLRISEERVQERTRKVPRVIIPSSSSSSLPGSRSPYRQHPKAQPVSPSTLVEKLDSIRRDQIRQKRANLRDDNEDGDSTVEVIPGPSSAIQSSSLMNSARSRPTQTAGSGRSKVPSKEKPKVQVVISLLTDDEDEDPDAAGPLSRPSLSSSKNYVPADNSNLMAYAQTSRLMNHGKTKKRVLVR